MKIFNNAKDCLEYLESKAKKGEEVMLDERATEIKPRSVSIFKKEKLKSQEKKDE